MRGSAPKVIEPYDKQRHRHAMGFKQPSKLEAFARLSLARPYTGAG